MKNGRNIGKSIPVIPFNMEPLMPSLDKDLVALSGEISEHIGGLREKLHPIIAKEVSRILSDMNSYYSNLIEGQPTYPREIERAFNSDFSSNPSEKEKQLLGLAHTQTEKQILENLSPEKLFSIDFIKQIHKTFYDFLPESMRVSKSLRGKEYSIKAGELRDFEVSVGQHQPPKAESLDAFLTRFCSFYKNISRGEMLIATAAAHHRLTWIHPFGDGNGRVTRLFTNAMLRTFDLDANGIWSMSRGLARNKSDYYKYLELADMDRQGDLDGRGTLSNRGLCEFCKFFLTTMRDQMDFMFSLLQVEKILMRYNRMLSEKFPKNTDLYMRIIKELWIFGEMPRGKASEIVGKSERTSRNILSELEREKFIKSDTPKSAVKIHITVDTSEEIFPKLFIG